MEKNNEFVLINFSAQWCEPCQWVLPILEEVAKNFDGKILLEKIDIDEHPHLSKDFHILSVPTLVLFHNEKELWRMRGFDTAANLTRTLQEFVTA
jgi:thioredoxin 1